MNWKNGNMHKKSKISSCKGFFWKIRTEDLFKGGVYFLELKKTFWTKMVWQRCTHRMITRVSAFESLQPEDTFSYLQHGHATSRKFSTGTWTWVIQYCGCPKSGSKHGFLSVSLTPAYSVWNLCVLSVV